VASSNRCKNYGRIYARKVIDKYLDAYSLSLGHELSDEGWEAKKREYLGQSRFPKEAIVDRGRKILPYRSDCMLGGLSVGSTFSVR